MSRPALQNFSVIRKLLSRDNISTLQRHIVVLAGNTAWQKESLNNILLNFEKDVLWVGEHAPGIYSSVEIKKSKSWLGNEKNVVIFDANEYFEPDSFSAISGVIFGGGFFFLLLPSVETWSHVYATNFGTRLIESISKNKSIAIIKQNSATFSLPLLDVLPTYINNIAPPFLTTDQNIVVDAIKNNHLNEISVPIVITADRGRGKSAALGLSAAWLLKSGVKMIAMTAPSLRATDIVFKHIVGVLPDAEVSRGRLIFENNTVQFYSPDQLVYEDIDADILMVDEAAAIPVPILTSFLKKYPQCIFSTTVHGYEGTGRGFNLRFFKELDKVNNDWLHLKMNTPIRWGENDPLEKWMFNLFCLDADISDVKNINLNSIEYKTLTKQQLSSNEHLLKDVFSLLVLAHYKTRPSDLKKLLDDENLSLYVAIHNEHVVAVALVIQEGSFSASLSTTVYRGERRPVGHLLAQSLTYHCGVEHAATLDYARVMRIAVHPELQEKGVGSKLLDFILQNEKNKGRDAIGTSFGMNERLLNFWKSLNFDVVRIGFKREQTSGEHAAIMLHALNNDGKKVFEEAVSRFNGQVHYLFDDVLTVLPLEIKDRFIGAQSLLLNALDIKDLNSFIHYSRNYELCMGAVNKTVSKKEDIILSAEFPNNFRDVLIKKVRDKLSWKAITKEMKLCGQQEARNLFHKALIYLQKLR